MAERVVVLGASPKEDRYSYKAVVLLAEYGHTPIPVHPLAKEIHGIPVVSELSSITGPVDTVSIYVNPTLLEQSVEAIIALKPKRVIMNPGTEAPTIKTIFEQAGITVMEACTLVLLKTHQF